ncbi:MAG: HEPN domain-containing protein [Bacteroidota bacterium]|nr:HEPN domain-containing protein [Bacteroidota bacterium]
MDDLSDYDLETAVAMLDSKRYLYVGFMCHQTIEKAFKAYFTKMNPDSVPFSHSLSYIAKRAGFYEMLNESQKDFIDTIEPLNIETRYPSHKEKLLRNLSFERCEELIQKTNELQKWIKLKL